MSEILKDKDNYIMHSSYNEHFKLLTNEELGRLIRDVNEYVQYGNIPKYTNEERVLNMAYSFMKATIDIEKSKYLKKCERNRENGRRGGRPKSQDKPNGLSDNPEKPNGLSDNPIDIDDDIDIEMDMDIGIDMEIDIDNEINNSVCNKETKFNCHLGSTEKKDSCFYCMKKNKCPYKESQDFKLKYPNLSFKEYCDRKEEELKKMNEKGEPIDIDESILDFDWFNGDEGS